MYINIAVITYIGVKKAQLISFVPLVASINNNIVPSMLVAIPEYTHDVLSLVFSVSLITKNSIIPIIINIVGIKKDDNSRFILFNHIAG